METSILEPEIGMQIQQTQDSSIYSVTKKRLVLLSEAKTLFINELDKFSADDICYYQGKEIQGIQLLLIKISSNVNMQHVCSNAVVTMNVFAKAKGKELVAKVIMVAIKSFCDSIMVARKMSLPDYMEVASIFLEKHPHESIDDILVALKEAKASGRKDYGGFGSQDVFAIFNEHLERKITFRENQHLDNKSQTKDWETTQMVSENSEIRQGIQKIRNAEREAISAKISSPNLQTELDDLCLILPTTDLDILEQSLELCRVISVSFERVCMLKDEIERRKKNNPQMESELLEKVQGNYVLTMKGMEEKNKYEGK